MLHDISTSTTYCGILVIEITLAAALSDCIFVIITQPIGLITTGTIAIVSFVIPQIYSFYCFHI